MFAIRAFVHVRFRLAAALTYAGALCLGLGLWIKARTGGWSPPAFDLCVLAGLCLGAAVLVGVARVFLGRAIAQRATDGDSASSPAFPAAR